MQTFSTNRISKNLNVVTCPPMLQVGTMVEINGQTYICEDRTAPKYRDRFDINCDQDKHCPYQVGRISSSYSTKRAASDRFESFQCLKIADHHTPFA